MTVSALGFSIYKTNGLPLKFSQIPLGLAVIAWGLSIFCGLKFIKYVISNLYANNSYFDILAGRHPELGKDPDDIKAGVEGIMQAMESNGKTANKYFKWQGRLFYSGIVLFVLWHVLEMYMTSKIIVQ